MIVWGCGVVVVTVVTGEAHRLSPKSPWSWVRRGGFVVESCIEFVPVVFNGFFVTTRNCLLKNMPSIQTMMHHTCMCISL